MQNVQRAKQEPVSKGVKFDPNPLCYFMLKTFIEQYASKAEPERRVFEICNEGGTRSSKTWDFFHFLYAVLDANRDAGWVIFCYRDTLKDCKEKTFADFKDCFKVMGVWNQDACFAENQKPEYTLFGSKILFRGLDEDVEGVKSHINFFNEAIEMSEQSVKSATRRCLICNIYDWNPKYTEHWLFKKEGTANVWWTRTDYRNNKHLQAALKANIEATCPWMLEDEHLPEQQRRPNLANIKNGTANRVDWLVYGRGVRAAYDGLVFPIVEYVDGLPESDQHIYGLDFGNTSGIYAFTHSVVLPDAVVYDCPIYGSFGTDESSVSNFYEAFKTYKMQRGKGVDWSIICDSANPAHRNDLNRWSERDGLNATFLPCKKFDGCVKWRIDKMKRRRVLLVRRKHIQREQENYRWKSINGIQINEPEKNGFDHFWDASGMSVQYADFE